MTKQAEEGRPIWATATSTNGERDIVFRFVAELSSMARRAQQPTRVFVLWRFESHNGLPSAQDMQRMDELEDALAPQLEADGFATLAIVSTGDGLREWTYYADSADEFMDRFNLALADSPPFPIELHDAPDPDWRYYTDFLANVQGEATLLDRHIAPPHD